MIYNKLYNINENIEKYVEKIDTDLEDKFKKLDKISEYNQIKVLKAFKDNNLSSIHFNSATGYGYADIGREVVESIFSSIFKSEDSLVRPNIVSGTHAISLVLFSLLNYGDKILSINGDPYDTLQQVIGIEGNKKGNLISKGIKYDKIELKNEQEFQYDKIKKILKDDIKLVMLQRSTGYTNRRAFSIEEIERAIKTIREVNEDVIIFVDNCYGEFTETKEPIEIGADIMAGSLIKNLGGGIALTGGYISGKKELVEYCSNTLTAPGIGKDEGLSFGTTRNVLQGLYYSSKTTIESIKVALLFAKAFDNLGFEIIPKLDDPRSDIVQAIKLNSSEKLELFAKAIQESCSVDSNLTPIADDMPGYEDKVIMSSGGFVEGATSELSCDGPLREPYTVYLQGGLNKYHGKLALMKVLEKYIDNKILDINSLV
ncbi:MAG: methionine gamma-lyase family protein [Anaerococcus hydrogenalis]|uniref:methionine gamma-lyase family protein n=1 Tax=Anaerococcus hydrogenalis TaxID=33029 RepID=UPI0029038862|nr:methionine gamma-lyase family protein [Anaerococcus hydrogenalis]MDU3199342.1 methionine gamma-lyase family protein [Anaerococcus hydrogenalis]MDU3688658.1 methionine gamma-lyase family protein [Anaerococcus hydrogenalis]